MSRVAHRHIVGGVFFSVACDFRLFYFVTDCSSLGVASTIRHDIEESVIAHPKAPSLPFSCVMLLVLAEECATFVDCQDPPRQGY